MVDLGIQQVQSNSLVNQAGSTGLPMRIAQAIQTASARTGVNFAYLLNKASQESGFDPNAKASSSSATGLFQFTSQTWLQMVKTYGAQYGLGDYAAHISADSSGALHASSPVWKQAILGLRKDPQLSAEMAGELDKANLGSLQANVGGKIGATELYLAHFLGAGGASDFIKTMRASPSTPAADVLPEAAAANPSVFYGKDGGPRTLKQIYQHFAQKFDQPSTAATTTTIASNTASPQIPTSFSSAASYALASTAYHNTLASGGYAPFAATGAKPDMSSLYADAIMAQMNMKDISTSADASDLSDARKKDSFGVLAAIG